MSIRRSVALLLAALALTSCARATGARGPGGLPGPGAMAHSIVPVPASVQITPTDSFAVDSTTVVLIDAAANADVERVGRFLAELIANSPGVTLRRLTVGETPSPKGIYLTLDTSNSALGDEGYELTITGERVTLAARRANGLFYGVQTIRQLLPISVEHPAAPTRVLKMPVVRIVDTPRFPWRGAMLDVARHFLSAGDVKRYIDLMALYKLNTLHLHLTDDQGWRIEILSWPNLTRYGGRLDLGVSSNGYYTQAAFADLVAYAQACFITIVPEIEMPGHSNAARASYPELTCDGTNIDSSTLCVDRDTVWTFVDDVVREIGALVPTPYFHIGGDEVKELTREQYLRYIERAQGIVNARGKQMIGWGEIATANLLPSTIVQHWTMDTVSAHVARGGKVILSPAKQIYLDMKYDSTTVLGLDWAGHVEVRDAYAWEPSTFLPGVPERAILGVEAPLWSETLVKMGDFEFMAFPRLVAVAELAWSPAAARDWDSFKLRLGAQGPRLAALGVNFYRSPQVPWAR